MSTSRRRGVIRPGDDDDNKFNNNEFNIKRINANNSHLLNSPIIAIFSVHPLIKLFHRVKHLFFSSTSSLYNWRDELRDIAKTKERRPISGEEIENQSLDVGTIVIL